MLLLALALALVLVLAAPHRSGAASAPVATPAQGSLRTLRTQMCDWSEGKKPSTCPALYSCVPLPQDLSQATCSRDPVGGSLYPQDSLPGKQVFYFPLTGGSLSSWPWGTRTGSLALINGSAVLLEPTDAAYTRAWRQDDRFNSTLWCEGDTQVLIPPIPYGRTGAFTIALWFKRQASSYDNLYEYLFSNTMSNISEQRGAAALWGTLQNQVELFLLGTPKGKLQGLARAIVKDSNDGPSSVFLDSDGAVSDSIRKDPLPGWTSSNLSDGWHHIALTSRLDGSQGYRMYVDGLLAAELPSQSTSAGPTSSKEVDGGDPLLMSGPITLCGRSDYQPTRTFTGALSQLIIVDSALDWREVNELWRAGQGATAATANTATVLLPTMYDSTQVMVPDVNISASPSWASSGEEGANASLGAAPAAPPADAEAAAAIWGVEAGQPCSLDLTPPSGLAFCKSGLICAPIHFSRISSVLMGVCAQPPQGVLIPSTWPPLWPTPLAYFPLSQQGQLLSWPQEAYNGSAQGAASWGADSRFGSALHCNNQAGNPAYVQLDPVPYALQGPFSLNLWVKSHSSDLNGSSYAYVYSHAAADASRESMEAFGPDQVHIFIPETDNLFNGLSSRVIVKDHDDNATGRTAQVWLDSNGLIGNDMTQGDLLPDAVHIGDGEWHMLTVSTLPGDNPGFAVFLDGILKGVISANSTRDVLDPADTQIQIPGGHPALLGGPITLCARSDLDPLRLFTGSISNLMLFDVGLQPEQVAALYQEYQRQAVIFPAGSEPAVRTTVGGAQRCAFPYSYGGQLMYDCMYVGGILQCPVEGNGTWLPCSVPAPAPSSLANMSGALDGTQLGPAMGTIPRLSSSGQVCILPFKYDNKTYTDCALLQGVERCRVAMPGGATAEGELQECAPIIQRPLNASRCVNPSSAAAAATVTVTGGGAASGSSPPLALDICVSILGVDMCTLGEGAWLRCPPAPRYASSGHKCVLPYTYNGLTRMDCVAPLEASTTPSLVSDVLSPLELTPPASSPALPSCPAFSSPGVAGLLGLLLGIPDLLSPHLEVQHCQPVIPTPVTLQPRFPIRYALNRQQCTVPGPAVYSECLDYSGSGTPQCQVVSGGFFDCAPVRRVGLVSNRSCSFPFTYRGQARTDCIWIAGVEACKMPDDGWEECSSFHSTSFPEPPPNTPARFTETGALCLTPYHYLGNLTWGCVGAEPGYCRTHDGWSPCARLDTNATKSTVSGQTCELPFLVNGALAYDCVLRRDGFAGLCPVDPAQTPSRESLSDYLPREGEGEGSGRAGATPRMERLAAGALLRGVRRARADGGAALMQPCAPPPRRTLAGEECVFPATYNGRKVTDCITLPGANTSLMCMSKSGAWDVCAALSAPALEPIWQDAVDLKSAAGLSPDPEGGSALEAPPNTSDSTPPPPGSVESVNSVNSVANTMRSVKRSHAGTALSLVFGLTALGAVLVGLGVMALQFTLRARHRSRSAVRDGGPHPPAPEHSTQLSTSTGSSGAP